MNKSFRAIAALTLFSLVSSFLTTHATAATPPSYFNDCGYPEYKPQSLTEFCADAGNGVTKIKWSSWTSTKAVGTGSFYVKLCDPNCADGKVVWAKAKVVLSGAKVTRGKRYLMNVTVTSTNGKPLPGESKSTSIRWVTDYWMG
jgi:hypothetical protein